MRVRATARGYYGSKVRDPGEDFVLTDPTHFSDNWMERTGGRDPLDHDGDGKKGGSLPRPAQVSNETTVETPKSAPKAPETI